MAYAVALGVFGALAALVFLGIIGHGAKWFSDANSGWLGGHWLWLAITVAAGVVVGVLHRVMHLPELTPGFVADLPDEHVDTKQVPGDRCGLRRVADRRRQPWPREGTRSHRRWCG